MRKGPQAGISTSPAVAMAVPIEFTRTPKINKPLNCSGYRIEDGDGLVKAGPEAVK